MVYEFDTTKQRSKIMKRIKSTDTAPEINFRKILWSKGIRYRKNDKNLPGKPDIAIYKYKVAIFIDGEFWHGYNWEEKKNRIKANRDYWIPKIEKNIRRGKKYCRQLRNLGWSVLRFWEQDIKKNQNKCLRRVMAKIQKREIKDGKI